MKKFIENALSLVSVLLLTWVFVSFVEIAIKNVDPNSTYTSWNFFINFVKLYTMLHA